MSNNTNTGYQRSDHPGQSSSQGLYFSRASGSHSKKYSIQSSQPNVIQSGSVYREYTSSQQLGMDELQDRKDQVNVMFT